MHVTIEGVRSRGNGKHTEFGGLRINIDATLSLISGRETPQRITVTPISANIAGRCHFIKPQENESREGLINLSFGGPPESIELFGPLYGLRPLASQAPQP